MSGEAERNAEDGEHTCAVCLEAMLPPVLPPTAPEQAPLLDSPEMESATLRCGHQLHLSCLLKYLLPHPSGTIATYSHRCPVCRCHIGDKVTSVTSQLDPSLFRPEVSGIEQHEMEMGFRIVVLQALLRVKERELVRVAEAARSLGEATANLGRRLGRLEKQTDSDGGGGGAAKRKRDSGHDEREGSKGHS